MTEPKTILDIPDAQELEREAAQWFVRFDAGDMSETDRGAFQQWYGKSEQHRDALDRVSAFWGGAEVLIELRDYAAADDVVGIIKSDADAQRNDKMRRRVIGAIAASLVVMSGVVISRLALNWDEDFVERYATVVGEQETIDLPDGSRIVLNTNSALKVAFDGDARRIEMTRGEAFFDVASDSDRPFSVVTNKGVATAVGTAFSVRVHEEKMDVLVTEGRVSLSATLQAEAESLVLTGDTTTEVSAGQAIEFSQSAQSIEIVRQDEAEKVLDWQDGIISFNGEALEEVIFELSRYTDITIDISDEALRQQKIVAYYHVGKIEPMFQALNLMAGVEIEYVGERHVRLYRAE